MSKPKAVQVTDASGVTRPAVIAEADGVVVDPLTGISRKVFADQPVPVELEGAYVDSLPKSKKTTEKPKTESKSSKKSD